MSEKDPFLKDGLSLTFQTRLSTSAVQDAALSSIAGLLSSIERRLYVQWRAGYSLVSLKNKTIAFYQIPARYFNAVKAGLEGKIRSVMTNLGNTKAKDGSLTARLRVPDALAGEHGQYLELTNIHFAHDGDAINAAPENNQRRQSLSLKAGRDQFGDLYKHYGQALSFRFVRDKKG